MPRWKSPGKPCCRNWEEIKPAEKIRMAAKRRIRRSGAGSSALGAWMRQRALPALAESAKLAQGAEVGFDCNWAHLLPKLAEETRSWKRKPLPATPPQPPLKRAGHMLFTWLILADLGVDAEMALAAANLRFPAALSRVGTGCRTALEDLAPHEWNRFGRRPN